MSTRTVPSQSEIDDVVRAVHPRVMVEIGRDRQRRRWAAGALGLAVIACAFSVGVVVGGGALAHPAATSLTECVA